MDTGLTSDELAVDREVRGAQAAEREISDGCARVIASWWYSVNSSLTYAFVSTGAIVTDDACELWRALASDYRDQPLRMRRALDSLGTYLINRADRGPVAGSSELWVTRPDDQPTPTAPHDGLPERGACAPRSGGMSTTVSVSIEFLYMPTDSGHHV